MHRKPKFASSPDANHNIVRDFMRDVCGGFEKELRGGYPVYFCNFRGVGFAAIDTCRLGGPFLDWMVSTDYGSIMLEVKTPEAYKSPNCGMTDNEKWTFVHLPYDKEIVFDDAGVMAAFERLLN